MKSAQLPPVRVTPSVRQQIERALHDGETLSQFVEKAAIEAAERRKVQQEFVARGRASLAHARKTGEYYSADEVMAAMQKRLDARLAELKQRDGTASRRRA